MIYADVYALPVTALGKNIRRLRRAADITQTQVGDLLGVQQGAVSKWEKGESEPAATNLPALAFFLHATLDELLKDVYPEYDDTLKPPKKSLVGLETAQERHLRQQLSDAKAIIRQLGKLGEEAQPLTDVKQKGAVQR